MDGKEKGMVENETTRARLCCGEEKVEENEEEEGDEEEEEEEEVGEGMPRGRDRV